MGEQSRAVEVGVAFEGPADRHTRLERIDLALGHRAGESEALVRIALDRDGRPDEDGVLESFVVSGEGDFSVRVERLRSRAKPVLREGVATGPCSPSRARAARSDCVWARRTTCPRR
jgi:hypothetical protein